MGYPMTWQRVMNRNRLQEAAYGDKVSGFNTKIADQLGALVVDPSAPPPAPLVGYLRLACRAIDQANSRWSLLVGDLKRLEQDAVDERAICRYIALRTGHDPDRVASILKELFRMVTS